MKSILLSDDIHALKRVYARQTVDELIKTAHLEDCCVSKQDILDHGDYYQDTEFIFSTWGMPGFTEEEIDRYFPSLKGIFYSAGTVQGFAKPFLKKQIKVFSAWAANAVPVAEYTAAQIILANKGFFYAAGLTNSRDYKGAQEVLRRYRGNYGAKIGIIGAGMIGKLVIQKLKSYDLSVAVFDPFLPDAAAKKIGVQKVSLEELFETSDVVSNHLANNPQTVGMLHYGLFCRMPKYATFINTGRGQQVVEADLCRVLSERADITALLDVTDPEPPKSDSDFYKLPNCILTPHIAGSFGNEVHRMSEYMLAEYRRYIANQPTKYEVTLKMLETMA